MSLVTQIINFCCLRLVLLLVRVKISEEIVLRSQIPQRPCLSSLCCTFLRGPLACASLCPEFRQHRSQSIANEFHCCFRKPNGLGEHAKMKTKLLHKGIWTQKQHGNRRALPSLATAPPLSSSPRWGWLSQSSLGVLCTTSAFTASLTFCFLLYTRA